MAVSRSLTTFLLLLCVFMQAQASSPLAEEDLSTGREDDPDEDLYIITSHGVPHVVEPATHQDEAEDEGEGDIQAMLQAVEEEAERLQQHRLQGTPLDPVEDPAPLVEMANLIYPNEGVEEKTEGDEEKDEEEDEEEDGSEEEESVSRRMITASLSMRWEKAIVPFRYTDEVGAGNIREIEAAMLRYERYTCFRFVPWEKNKTRHEYGLQYEGHLRFIIGSGCYSVLGFSRSEWGQSVSCCNRAACTHELGHALGMHHEHQNPLRDGWIRVNYDKIPTDDFNSYSRDSMQISYGYDYSSRMHYHRYSGNRYTWLFPELRSHETIFYFFKEVSTEHDCTGLVCPGTTLECHNDGYPAVVEGHCSCLCPEGLTPESGCQDVNSNGPNNLKWPAGSFALFKTETGCPEGSEIFDDTGSVVHHSEGVSANGKYLAGRFTGNSLTYQFCVAKEGRSSSLRWGTGRYCVFRKGGTCPEDFLEGSIQYDDHKPGEQSGAIPDGVYNDDTRLYFCCRDDGFTEEPLVLPNSKPFVLFRVSDACQTVEGMRPYAADISFNNKNTDLVAFEGLLPSRQYVSSYKLLTLRYCYYVPANRDCGGVIELTRDKRTATFSSPAYPSPYPHNLDCHWLVTAPEGSTMLLSFDDFDVEGSKTACPDKVNVRNFRLGQPGITYCGDGMDASVRTLNNSMMIRFTSDNKGENRGFKAKVELVLPEDSCYSLEDQGRSYKGRVNFTRNFAPCLNWRDVAHCRHSQFQPRDVEAELSENYCRNPGDGLMPWCYTQAKDCIRDYCDVCLLQKPVDRSEDCAEQQQQGICEDTALAQGHCAKTCQDKVIEPLRQEVKPAREVTCPAPPEMEDAVIVTSPETTGVGSVVTYRCKTGDVEHKRTCLTSGEWSGGGYVCGGCPTRWVPYRQACYFYPGTNRNFRDANIDCARYMYGATVAPAFSMDDLYFLSNLTMTYQDTWLGITDDTSEGEWRLLNGTEVTWANWKPGEPNNQGGNEDNAIARFGYADKHWLDLGSSGNRPFICRLVPGGCPEGWQEYEGACYLFENIKRKFHAARGHCGRQGAKIAAPKDEREMAFLLELLDNKGDMLIGISDERQEGVWMTEEGTEATYTNWRPNEPNDHKGREDAAVAKMVDSNKGWNDVPTSYSYYFICKLKPNVRAVCADRRSDCRHLVEQTPNLCQQQQDFAWAACPATCNMCS